MAGVVEFEQGAISTIPTHYMETGAICNVIKVAVNATGKLILRENAIWQGLLLSNF